MGAHKAVLITLFNIMSKSMRNSKFSVGSLVTMRLMMERVDGRFICVKVFNST